MSKIESTRVVIVGEVRALVELALENIQKCREEKWEREKQLWRNKKEAKSRKSWIRKLLRRDVRVYTDAEADEALRNDEGDCFDPSTHWWTMVHAHSRAEELLEKLDDLCNVTKETDKINLTATDAQILRSWADWKPAK